MKNMDKLKMDILLTDLQIYRGHFSYFNNWPHNTYMKRWLFHWLTNIWRDGYSIGWNRAFGGVRATTCWVFFTADPSRITSCVASSTAAASVGEASISSTGTAILILSSCFKNMSGWICVNSVIFTVSLTYSTVQSCRQIFTIRKYLL